MNQAIVVFSRNPGNSFGTPKVKLGRHFGFKYFAIDRATNARKLVRLHASETDLIPELRHRHAQQILYSFGTGKVFTVDQVQHFNRILGNGWIVCGPIRSRSDNHRRVGIREVIWRGAEISCRSGHGSRLTGLKLSLPTVRY